MMLSTSLPGISPCSFCSGFQDTDGSSGSTDRGRGKQQLQRRGRTRLHEFPLNARIAAEHLPLQRPSTFRCTAFLSPGFSYQCGIGKAGRRRQRLCCFASGSDDGSRSDEESEGGIPVGAPFVDSKLSSLSLGASRPESSSKDAAIISTLATLSKTLQQLSKTLVEISGVVNATALAVQDAAVKIEALQNVVGQLEAFSQGGGESANGDGGAELVSAPLAVRGAEEESRSSGSGLENVSPLAMRLQQAFYQARIYGLGKPLEIALDDFVSACMEAAMDGMELKDLQLQLILASASLPQPFAPSSGGVDFIRDEEMRVRSTWVRLVYTTLHEVARGQIPAADPGEDVDQVMGMAIRPYVQEVLKMRNEKGYDLQRLKLEHSLNAGELMPSVKLMREIHYLILLTATKAPKGQP